MQQRTRIRILGFQPHDVLMLHRFCSLFNVYVGLLSALEDGRDLVMVAAGPRGIAALRSVVDWTPVQVRKQCMLRILQVSPPYEHGAAVLTLACWLLEWFHLPGTCD